MAEHEDPNNVPLGERFKKAQYLARELSEHLRQAYLPKLSDLRTASKEFDPDEVSDQQMMDRMQAVIEAEEFAQNIHQQLDGYLKAIAEEMQGTLFGLEQNSSGQFYSPLSGRYHSPFASESGTFRSPEEDE